MVKSIDSMVDKNKKIPIVSWQAPQFIYYKKTFWWYFILIVVSLGLEAVFYFTQKNYLAMVMIALAATVFIIMAAQKPKRVFYKIDDTGIMIGEKIFSYSIFKSFYITYTDSTPTLHLEKIKRLSTPIGIILANVDEKKVIEILKLFLPENTKTIYQTTDLFSKWFKF